MKYNLSKPIDKQNAIAKFKSYLDKGANIELSLVRAKRSISQNAYLHVCITLYAIAYGVRLEEMKATLKHWYGLFTINKDGATIYGKTSAMDSKELTTFIEWIRTHCLENTGEYIPSSEQYIQEQLYYDGKIDGCREYL